MRRINTYAIVLCMFAVGCSSRGPGEQEILQEIGRIPLLTAVPDTALASVVDYLVAPSGVIYIADYRLHRLILLDEDHKLERVIGRDGQGPGEFQWPSRLALVGDTVKVWDRISGRLQNFSRDGEFLSMVRPNPGVSGILPVSMSDEGRLLVSTYGIGSEYLLHIYNRGLSGVTGLGTLEAPPTSILHMGLDKSDARSGTIPDWLKNRVFTVPSDDGCMFLIHTGIPVFKKYDASGRELWRTEQDHPRLRAIREEAFERTLQETGNQSYSPNFWRGGVGDGSGGCFLQLRVSEQTVLFHLHADGALGEPMAGPEGDWGTLRRYNGFLWLLDSGTLELLQLRVGS